MTNDIQTYTQAIRASVETRRAYEIAKNASCDSMLAHLKTFDKTLTNDALVTLLCAANVNADTLNRRERSSACFNIYAFTKLLTDVTVTRMNHYTRAIVASCVALNSHEIVMQHADAVAACSLDIKHKDSKRASHIKASRYQKHVAANTASTQASSSLNALVALNVLTETRDASNVVCYALTDSALAQAMIAHVSA